MRLINYLHDQAPLKLVFLAMMCLAIFTSCDLLNPEEDDDYLHVVAFAASNTDYDEHDIYMILEDGTEQIQVLDAGGNDVYPRFHPTLKLLYFLSDRNGEGKDIYSVDTTGQVVTQITTGFYIDNFEFSPDGEHIVFQTLQPDTFANNIYRITEDGSALEFITAGEEPYYGKNSGKLFYTEDSGPGDLHLYTFSSSSDEEIVTTTSIWVTVVDHTKNRDEFMLDYRLLAGTHNWQIIDDRGTALVSPQLPQGAEHAGLSDEGRWIAFIEWPEGADAEQVHTGTQNMASKNVITDNSYFKSAPDFYHDDFRIMYRAYNSTAQEYSLRKASSDGGKDKKITESYEYLDEVYAISPDFW